MANLRIKANDLVGSWVISIPYADLQRTLSWSERIGYTAGVYGWNSDVFAVQCGDTLYFISTGYRPVKGINPDRDSVRALEQTTTEISEKDGPTYEEKREEVRRALMTACERWRKEWRENNEN